MLTRQDYDTLIEAVEAWEAKDFGSRLIGTMLGAMACGKDDESREKFEADQEKQRVKSEAESRVRKERGVMLRSKLISLRDSADADALLSSASTTL
jgi:hypothetical protein